MRTWPGILTSLAAIALVALFATACSDDPVTEFPPGERPRLIPPTDGEFPELEAPEAEGECERDADCEVSCVHACAVPTSGPVTCPTEPPPTPARVDGAFCLCERSVCAYYDEP